MAPFEHPLLSPLYRVLADERRSSPVDLSAANLVAHRLLQSPYLGQTYQDWHLVERAPDEWRLVQYAPGGQLLDRDPLLLFYRDPFQDDLSLNPTDGFVLTPRPETLPLPAHPPARAPQPSAGVEEHAQALLERVHQAHPAAVDRLLQPTAQQLEQRQRLQVEALSPHQLTDTLRRLLGPLHDASLRAYGLDYHTAPSYQTPDTNVYLLAHNGEEVAGIMKLGNSQGWGYGVGYVCVAPGFRQQGLSLKLYQAAIDRCIADEKVLVRSDPGDFTPVQATAAFDRLLRQNPVLHAPFHSPAQYGLASLHEKGVPYAEQLQAVKPACDATLRSPEQRQARDHALSPEQREAWIHAYGPVFQALLGKPTPAAGTAPRRSRP